MHVHIDGLFIRLKFVKAKKDHCPTISEVLKGRSLKHYTKFIRELTLTEVLKGRSLKHYTKFIREPKSRFDIRGLTDFLTCGIIFLWTYANIVQIQLWQL